MRGIVVPERTEDFTADPVELTFDLAFVFAFSRLVGLLLEDPTWGGVAEVVLLFVLLWLPWTQFTWSANAVAGNGRVVRLIFLAATVASLPMAAAVTTAFEGGGPVFAVSLCAIYAAALATMALGLERGSAEFGSVVRYAVPNLVAIACILLGSVLGGGARVSAWVAGVAIVVLATVLAGAGDWIVRSGHFAERHGLIFIVALGEVLVATAAPLAERFEEGAGLAGTSVAALVAAGIFAGVLWWSYFDRPQPALEHHAEGLQGRERARFSRDAYTYAHAPIVAGVILAAAGLEEIVAHPEDPVPLAFRAMLVGGLALVSVGVSTAVGRAFRIVAKERLAAVVAIAVLVMVGGGWTGVALLSAVDTVLLAALAVEHLRIEHPERLRRAPVA